MNQPKPTTGQLTISEIISMRIALGNVDQEPSEHNQRTVDLLDRIILEFAESLAMTKGN